MTSLPPREPGTPCWFEIGGPPEERLLDFWSRAAGWEIDVNAEVHGYRRGWAGGQKVAGFGGPPEPSAPGGWRVYVHVDDLRSVLEGMTTAGASVALPETAAGPDGRFAFIRDPFGVVTGLFEPHDDPGTAREPGPGRVASWAVHVPDPDGFAGFHAPFLPGLAEHVQVHPGESGWEVLVRTPDGRHDGEVADPAGNRLTFVSH